MVLRVVSGAFALLFLFGAIVQWNDPDPLRWMIAYLAAAGVSGSAALGQLRPLPTGIVLAGLVAWLVLWLPAFAHTSLDAMQHFGMSGSVEEEEVREAWGLLLLALWTGVLLALSLRRRAS
jgi:hypothetical protein